MTNVHKKRKINLVIFTPKKTSVCIMFKNRNLSEDESLKHLEKSSAALKGKKADRTEDLENKKVFTYVVDLQAFLLSPYLNVPANYYRTKLKMHN